VKFVFFLVALFCAIVSAHGNDEKRPPIEEFPSKPYHVMDPAVVCLSKNTTDAKVNCLINIVSTMQIELAEQKGMFSAGGKKCKYFGIGVGVLISLCVLGGIIRCCVRCRRWRANGGCRFRACCRSEAPVQENLVIRNAGPVIYAQVPQEDAYPAQIYAQPQTNNVAVI